MSQSQSNLNSTLYLIGSSGRPGSEQHLFQISNNINKILIIKKTYAQKRILVTSENYKE
jgi:hypothetical protein